MSTSDLEETMAFQIRVAKLPEPEREYRVCNTRRWRTDFAWPEKRVALEVEGGQWSNGRHVRGQGYENDCLKYSALAIAGWCVIRATGAMVNDGRALALVEQALKGGAE